MKGFVFVIIVLLCINVFPLSAYSDSSDYDYEVLENGTARITKYNGDSENIVVPSELNGYVVTEIGERAFYDNDIIKYLIIPDYVSVIDKEAFCSCNSLISVKVLGNISYTGDKCFALCSSLEEIVFQGTILNISSEMFYNSGALKTFNVWQDGTEVIGKSAFNGCYSLNEVIIPNSVKIIEDRAFYCPNLSSLLLGDSVESIGEYSIYKYMYEDFVIPYYIDDVNENAILDTNAIRNIYILYQNAEINMCRFNSLLENVYYVGSKDTLKLVKDENCNCVKHFDESIIQYDFDADNYEGFKIDYDKLYDFGLNYLESMGFIYEESTMEEIVKESYGIRIKKISKTGDMYYVRVIQRPSGLMEVVHSYKEEKREFIGDADYNLNITARDALEILLVSAGIEEININEYWRYNAKKDGNIDSADALAVLKYSAGIIETFDDPSGYEYVTFNDGTAKIIKYIGESERIIIPSEFNGCTVTEIEERAFYNNDRIRHVIIPDSVNVIGEEAFASCEALLSINVMGNISYVGDGCFAYCTRLTDAEFQGTLSNISTKMFYNAEALKEFSVWQDGVESIGEAAFYGCAGLKEIIIPDSVKRIENEAFYNCKNAPSVYLGNSIEYIGEYAFYQNRFLSLPNSLIKVGNFFTMNYDNSDLIIFNNVEGIKLASSNLENLYILYDNAELNICDVNNKIKNIYYVGTKESLKLVKNEVCECTAHFDESIIHYNFDVDSHEGMKIDYDKLINIGMLHLEKIGLVYNESTMEEIVKESNGIRIKKISDTGEMYYVRVIQKPSGDIEIIHSEKEEKTKFIGDADYNLQISARDALKILYVAAGIEEININEHWRYNAKKDGAINSADALQVLKYSAGIIDRL